MPCIAYLACAETLPGSPTRRADAFEHDAMVAALRPAFAARGLELIEIDWRAPLDAFDGMALALIGTPWDYQDHPAEFLARLEALEAGGVRVANPPEVVRWNYDKRYLRELAEHGARRSRRYGSTIRAVRMCSPRSIDSPPTAWW